MVFNINKQYDFTPSVFQAQGAALLYCAYSRFDFTWRSMMHSHPHTELFCCTRGKGMLHIADERLHVGEGDIFVITPHAIHTEYSSLDDPLEYVVLGLEQVAFSGPSGETPRFFLFHQPHGAEGSMRPFFLDILREVEAKKEGYQAVCKHMLDILLIKIGRELTVGVHQPVSKTTSRECAKVKQLIDQYFTQPITLDWLAQKANLSKYYLTRTFHKHYGLPPMRYLGQRRVMEAMYLLLNTDHSTAEVSSMAGFSSPSYFAQAFRRAMGVSPQQYRTAKPAMLRAREEHTAQ